MCPLTDKSGENFEPALGSAMWAGNLVASCNGPSEMVRAIRVSASINNSRDRVQRR